LKSLEVVNTEKIALNRILRGLLVELRPKEWTKNLLIFSGLIFSHSLFEHNNLLLAFGGFIAFCLASSGIYIFNDLCDIKEDQLHPIKKNRPLASGALNANFARIVMILLFVGASALALSLDYFFAIAIAIYLAFSLSYSLGLKNAVILDVLIISSGFVIRAIAGAIILNVEPSAWLVLCTLMVALLVGFGKRRHELVLLEENAGSHRASLNEYSLQFLDSMMTICGGAAVVCYALYTMSDDTVSRFHTRNLLITLPFVIYGVFRYLFLIHRRKQGGDPVQLLFRDRPTLINILLWIIAVCLVIYLPKAANFSMSLIR
jgi:4-hydroxybenzoate polyprenyltransferase